MEHFYRRIEAWKDTEAKAPAPLAPSVKLNIDQMSSVFPEKPRDFFDKLRVQIHDMDSIDLGLKLSHDGFNPVVLILADDCFPGGCVATGSGAQEEAMFRRTNLCRVLSMKDYPLRDNEAIYAPRVIVFKNSELAGFSYLEARRELAFIACPGIRHPMLTSDDRLSDIDAGRLREKIRLILAIARDRGHDSVVLGAIGCGAWKCPPDHVAEIFAEVISKLPLRSFARLDFAILRGTAPGYITVDHRTGQKDNTHEFNKVFAL